MATLLTTEGGVTAIAPAQGRRSFTLAELQHYVGGYIEIVPAPGGTLLVVNEHGRLDGLPVNEAATTLFRIVGGDLIVGDAVRCTREEMGE